MHLLFKFFLKKVLNFFISINKKNKNKFLFPNNKVSFFFLLFILLKIKLEPFFLISK